MAEMEYAGQTTSGGPAAVHFFQRISRRLLDWEDWLTLVLALAAALTVSAALEGGGWSQDMPPITLVSALAVVASMLIAGTRLTAWLAWPIGVMPGAFVTFWQTLEMVGPGNFEQRIDQIYFRFRDWFDLAFTGGVSNDSLPFDVLVLGLTWLGVFLFGWSVYRWHNAWIGLIPGGVALFVDLVFVGDDLSGVVLLYLLFGFLLVMRTNLMARIAQWRAEGTEYPALISLTFINFSAWSLMGLLTAAWIAPVGPFSTPPVVEALGRGVEEIGVNFVRLSGPLEVKKVVPVHNYTGVLPFQGSVKLGDREVLTIQVLDESIEGPIPLRGAVYDVYTPGGWQAGERRTYDAPPVQEPLEAALADGSLTGRIIPLTIHVERKSVVGTVLFSAGEPLSANVKFQIEVPAAGVVTIDLSDGPDGLSLLDEFVAEVGNEAVLLKVERDSRGQPAAAEAFFAQGGVLADTLVAKPPERLEEGQSYAISGFIPTTTPEELENAGQIYPGWIERQYLQLPDTLPDRVRGLARDVTGYSPDEIAGIEYGCAQARCGPIDVRDGDDRPPQDPLSQQAPYEAVKAIEEYLRAYPLDYRVGDIPPGADGVDHFLFESRRGYFDYHASAMVVMLRTLGIPSRLAVGYVIDESDFDVERDAYSVRDRNSYSWAEVYFPDYGWIPFNPSPDRPAELVPTVREDLPANGDAPPAVDEPPNLPLNEDTIDALPEPGVDDGQLPIAGSRDQYNPLLTAAVFGFVAMVAGAIALGWQRSVAGLPYSQQLWEKTVRLATWAGHAPEPGQTPAEFGRHLERTFHGEKGFSSLASIYNRSRFGKRDVEGEEREQLREMWPDLRGDLLAAIPRRFLKRRK